MKKKESGFALPGHKSRDMNRYTEKIRAACNLIVSHRDVKECKQLGLHRPNEIDVIFQNAYTAVSNIRGATL